MNVPLEQWRNPAYLRFLRYEGFCVVCSRRPQIGCDPMHGPVNGMGSKGPDADAVPGCREHHNEQHAIGWPAFEGRHEFDREEVARGWWTKFKEKR